MEEGNCNTCRAKSDGVLITRIKDIKKGKRDLSSIMNERLGGRAEMIRTRVKINVGQSYLPGRVERGETLEENRRLKVGEVSSINSKTAEMLIYRGYVFVEWMM